MYAAFLLDKDILVSVYHNFRDAVILHDAVQHTETADRRIDFFRNRNFLVDQQRFPCQFFQYKLLNFRFQFLVFQLAQRKFIQNIPFKSFYQLLLLISLHCIPLTPFSRT